jgi:hypothetical protein
VQRREEDEPGQCYGEGRHGRRDDRGRELGVLYALRSVLMVRC